MTVSEPSSIKVQHRNAKKRRPDVLRTPPRRPVRRALPFSTPTQHKRRREMSSQARSQLDISPRGAWSRVVRPMRINVHFVLYQDPQPEPRVPTGRRRVHSF